MKRACSRRHSFSRRPISASSLRRHQGVGRRSDACSWRTRSMQHLQIVQAAEHVLAPLERRAARAVVCARRLRRRPRTRSAASSARSAPRAGARAGTRDPASASAGLERQRRCATRASTAHRHAARRLLRRRGSSAMRLELARQSGRARSSGSLSSNAPTRPFPVAPSRTAASFADRPQVVAARRGAARRSGGSSTSSSRTAPSRRVTFRSRRPSLRATSASSCRTGSISRRRRDATRVRCSARTSPRSTSV